MFLSIDEAQKVAQDQKLKDFWKSCTIMDYFNVGNETYALGKINMNDGTTLLKSWKTQFGINSKDEPDYIFQTEDEQHAINMFQEIISKSLNINEVTYKKSQSNGARVIDSQMTLPLESREENINKLREKAIEEAKENDYLKYCEVLDVKKSLIEEYKLTHFEGDFRIYKTTNYPFKSIEEVGRSDEFEAANKRFKTIDCK